MNLMNELDFKAFVEEKAFSLANGTALVVRKVNAKENTIVLQNEYFLITLTITGDVPENYDRDCGCVIGKSELTSSLKRENDVEVNAVMARIEVVKKKKLDDLSLYSGMPEVVARNIYSFISEYYEKVLFGTISHDEGWKFNSSSSAAEETDISLPEYYNKYLKSEGDVKPSKTCCQVQDFIRFVERNSENLCKKCKFVVKHLKGSSVLFGDDYFSIEVKFTGQVPDKFSLDENVYEKADFVLSALQDLKGDVINTTGVVIIISKLGDEVKFVSELTIAKIADELYKFINKYYAELIRCNSHPVTKESDLKSKAGQVLLSASTMLNKRQAQQYELFNYRGFNSLDDYFENDEMFEINLTSKNVCYAIRKALEIKLKIDTISDEAIDVIHRRFIRFGHYYNNLPITLAIKGASCLFEALYANNILKIDTTNENIGDICDEIALIFIETLSKSK